MVALSECAHLGEERLDCLWIDVATVDLTIRCEELSRAELSMPPPPLLLTVKVLDLVPDTVVNVLQVISALLVNVHN